MIIRLVLRIEKLIHSAVFLFLNFLIISAFEIYFVLPNYYSENIIVGSVIIMCKNLSSSYFQEPQKFGSKSNCRLSVDFCSRDLLNRQN